MTEIHSEWKEEMKKKKKKKQKKKKEYRTIFERRRVCSDCAWFYDSVNSKTIHSLHLIVSVKAKDNFETSWPREKPIDYTITATVVYACVWYE